MPAIPHEKITPISTQIFEAVGAEPGVARYLLGRLKVEFLRRHLAGMKNP